MNSNKPSGLPQPKAKATSVQGAGSRNPSSASVSSGLPRKTSSGAMTSRAAKPSSALLAAKKAARDRLKQEESSASSVFHKNTGQDDTIHPKILQAARSTGQLNLSGRGLVIVPERVWKITELDKEEEAKVKNKGFSMDAVPDGDNWWDYVELSKLILASNQIRSIPSDIQNLESLVFLDLHDNLLQSLPEEIGMLENLTRINLNHNKLKELPVEFFRLKNLKSLTVSNNELEQLHEDVGQLAYLETLDLAYNKLGSLPPSLGYCSNLKKLDCNNNKLRGVPNDLSSLHKLTTLDLSDNGLEVWPETFNAFSKLETLYLKNNKLMLMPGLRECPHLKEIHLGYNRLQKLTVDDIENLPNIHLLDLRDNRINAIPDEIVNLQTLERLDLSSNDLSNLPFAIGTMPNIKTLSIEGNPMKSIRRDILKRGTVELMKYLRSRMSDEELAKMREIGNVSPVANICDSPPVPDKYAMKTNATMNMSKKDINTLPDEAVENAQEAKVKAVDLSRNQFTELPNNMEPILPRLFELNMSFNRLEKIAPFIGLAQSLAYLNVGNNRLSDLPAELSQIPHLRELAIPFNQFSKIPEVVFSCLKLETLVMCDNKLTEIPVEGLAKLERLAILDLSNNNINSVPGELGLMRQLQGLQLEGNAFRVPRRDLLLKGTEAVLKYLRDKIPANKQ